MTHCVYTNDSKYSSASKAGLIHLAIGAGGDGVSAGVDLTAKEAIDLGRRLILEAEKGAAAVIAEERAQEIAVRVLAIVARPVTALREAA